MIVDDSKAKLENCETLDLSRYVMFSKVVCVKYLSFYLVSIDRLVVFWSDSRRRFVIVWFV